MMSLPRATQWASATMRELDRQITAARNRGEYPDPDHIEARNALGALLRGARKRGEKRRRPTPAPLPLVTTEHGRDWSAYPGYRELVAEALRRRRQALSAGKE